MDNDRKVRELRKKITELTNKASEKGNSKKVVRIATQLKDFDEYSDILRMYGVLEEDNMEDIKHLKTDLKILYRELKSDLKTAIISGRKSTFREMAEEMQYVLSNSPVMQRLPKEEYDNIIKSFTFEPSMRKEEYIRNVKAEIAQFEDDRNMLGKLYSMQKELSEENPKQSTIDAKELYDAFIKQQKELQKELDYRDAQRETTTTYNALCEAYKALEKCKQGLLQPELSKKEKKELERARKDALKDIEEYMDSEYSKVLFDKDGNLKVSEDKLKSALKAQIQDLAFEKNRLNGIVDDKAVKKDYYDIIKVGVMRELETATNLFELQKKEKETEEHQKNSDVKKFTKKLRLKLVLENLKRIYMNEARLKGLEERLAVLSNKPKDQLTQQEIAEMQKLRSEILEIRNDINKISREVNRVKQLGSELGIDCIIHGNIDFNSVDQIDNIVLPQVEEALQNQRDEANLGVYKVLDRYGISEKDLRPTTIRVKMNEVVDDIRKNRRYRMIDLDYNNTKRAIMFNSNPGKVYYSKAPDKETSQKDEEIDEEYDEDHTISVIKKMNVDYTSLQLDTIDDRYKQRVECGRVYRYMRGEGPYELNFVSEDLGEYLDNPKKKLDKVLDELRDRMIKELGDKEALADFCEESAENKYIKHILSDNFVKRTIAKKKFIRDLEKANQGNEILSYVNMAIALNSEILPEEIDATLSRLAQPYTRESDIKKYVIIKEKNSALGLIHKKETKVSYSKLVDTQKQKEQENEMHFEINTRSARDGMVRPFEFDTAEMWDYTTARDKQRDNKKTKTKNHEQDGEIE